MIDATGRAIAGDAMQAVIGSGASVTELVAFQDYLATDAAASAEDLDAFLAEARRAATLDQWSTYDLDSRIAAYGLVPPDTGVSPSGPPASSSIFPDSVAGAGKAYVDALLIPFRATEKLLDRVAAPAVKGAERLYEGARSLIKSLPTGDSVLKWIKIVVYVIIGGLVIYIVARLYLFTRTVQKA